MIGLAIPGLWARTGWPPENTRRLVEAYNSRPLGRAGFRRVSVRLENDGQVTRTYSVVNVWAPRDSGLATLYFLTEPIELRGTAYLQMERANRDPDVHLFLPTAKRPVRIAAGLLSEGLLGSDFAYLDLMWMLPGSRRYSGLKGGDCDGALALHLSSDPGAPDDLQEKQQLYFSRDQPFLLGMDGSPIGRGERRRFRVLGWRDISGTRTASEMTMEAGASRRTRIALETVRLGLSAETATLLTPEQLPRIGRALDSGWPR